MAQAIRQLDLAAGAGLDSLDRGEDLRSQHVPADDGQVGRGIGGFRLLDHVADPIQAVAAAVVADGFGIHDAIGGDVLARHFHQREHGGAEVLVDVEQAGACRESRHR